MSKAKERRAILDQMLTARASVVPAERPALAARQLGPIAEQAHLYAEHVATRAKLYDEAKAEGRLLLELDPKTIRATDFRNRHERSLLADDPKFLELKQSLAAHQHVDEATQKQMREELKDWAEAWLRKRLEGP